MTEADVTRPAEQATPGRPVPPGPNETRQISTAPTPLQLPLSEETFAPSFSPTGTALIFQTGRERSSRLLEAKLTAEGVPRQIVTLVADGAKNYHARVSPDERWVAFDSDRDGDRAVYVASRDGSGIRRMSPTGFAAVPTWSPDGKSLAFVRSDPRRPQVWNLWVRDLATSRLRQLTSYRYGQVWAGSWFPDARRICYSHETELVVLDITNGSRKTFRSPLDRHLLRTPAVSPDGRRIIFQVFHDGIWLLDVETGAMRRIADDSTAQEFAWDPHGTRVAYHSHRGGRWRIWMASVPS